MTDCTTWVPPILERIKAQPLDPKTGVIFSRWAIIAGREIELDNLIRDYHSAGASERGEFRRHPPAHFFDPFGDPLGLRLSRVTFLFVTASAVPFDAWLRGLELTGACLVGSAPRRMNAEQLYILRERTGRYPGAHQGGRWQPCILDEWGREIEP